jgi:hypothetical protein
VKLCPVDLSACDRPHCRGGHCEMAESRHFVICWECGKVDSHGIVHGICVECVAVTVIPDEQ